MRIWAISDLHLGFSTGKWMDRFGPHWENHAGKIEAGWRESVSPDDLVLLAGDFSWAMKPEEARRDFLWLGALPGKKVLIKGNHDYWWPKTQARMAELLPPGTFAMKRKALAIDGVSLIGVRGADFVSPEELTPEKTDELGREKKDLQLSIDHLKTLPCCGRPPIAIFHHPPFPLGQAESLFTKMVEEAGAKTCIYGHLHTPDDWEKTFQGELRGVTYRLTSADFLEFRPLLIEEF